MAGLDRERLGAASTAFQACVVARPVKPLDRFLSLGRGEPIGHRVASPPLVTAAGNGLANGL